MKKLQIKQLNEKEKEIVDALISLGMSRPVARVLAYLQYSNLKCQRRASMWDDCIGVFQVLHI